MKILSIETSCDETGIALLEAAGGVSAPRLRVIKNLVASQIAVHRPFGGVVPNLAKREHLKNLPVLYRELFGEGRAEAALWKKIGLVTVTVGPGLEPALWTGVEFAKSLAKQWKKPLVGANHLEGHLYSFLLSAGKKGTVRKIFPSVALIVSGGHTVLLRMESFTKWRRIGETRDDAAGEAFDKVARLLELPYPGGPEIEKLARKGDGGAIAFPRPMLHDKSFDFSFSGLKTAVLYYIRNKSASDTAGFEGRSSLFRPANHAVSEADIAASFQKATIDVLIAKTARAARECAARSVILSGGVAANKALRAALKKEAKKLGCEFLVPDFKYNLDNGAMIAAAGYMAHLRKKRYKLAADGGLEI